MPVVDCPPERKRTHRSRVVQDIIAMQRIALQDALTAIHPLERHSAMRAYDTLEERRQMLKGKPGRLSGRVDPVKPTRKRKVQSGPDVWTDPTAPKV